MNQDIINIGIALFGALFGWVLKTVWNAVTTLQADLKEIERELHTSYVSKDDYRQDILEVKDILKQIFDKLDKKADK
jgi:antirestriction protein